MCHFLNCHVVDKENVKIRHFFYQLFPPLPYVLKMLSTLVQMLWQELIFFLSFYKHLFISRFLESINFRLDLFTRLLTRDEIEIGVAVCIFQRCLWQKEDLLTNEITPLERISPHCAESVACATYVTQRIFVISSLSPSVRCRGVGDGGGGRCSGFRGGRHQYHGSPAVRWKVTKLSCSILCLLILNLATKW